MDETRLRGLHDDVLDWRHKGIPASAHGLTIREWIASGPPAPTLPTPVVTLSAQALEHNLRAMAAWCAERGLALAPHGKATMAPQLWRRQLDAGAAAITVANPFQAGVAHRFGVPRILIANQIADPAAAVQLSVWAEEGARMCLFSDSEVPKVRVSEAASTTIDVLVELGAVGGRAGARSIEAALKVAAGLEAAPNLRLAGVAGYEGAVASATGAADLAAVDDYLGDLATLFGALDFETDRPVVSAGGSAYFDRVAVVLGPLAPRAEVLLRSGSYLVHDHGCYARTTPAARGGDGPELLPALRGRATVLSRPEPDLAILDAGRRDLPFDQDLPIPLGHNGKGDWDAAAAQCPEISDQHLFLTGAAGLAVGDVVELGLSHPCTAFDKWRLIPVVDDETGLVVDAVHTFF
ncbi:alanine racemase [Glycomyces algeriensis]|uniref:Alanine racemase n=1 Tax=Glycomyces algeriensis TaxID=256037 RepID=A0A9W6G698_9ACTN|nr:alanine racemase [Glycomyces algeriensis]MDA1366018.1 alanine racemase [Glycomyces algeriensis]MDR7349215.1 D-serine deaminase-like pyridoxal phosphate-dependent protein [Glycomyces algeriensis]GLI41915.1 alanine racemase [Glycomyces algeriensis]